jgi:hypothetical protein
MTACYLCKKLTFLRNNVCDECQAKSQRVAKVIDWTEYKVKTLDKKNKLYYEMLTTIANSACIPVDIRIKIKECLEQANE